MKPSEISTVELLEKAARGCDAFANAAADEQQWKDTAAELRSRATRLREALAQVADVPASTAAIYLTAINAPSALRVAGEPKATGTVPESPPGAAPVAREPVCEPECGDTILRVTRERCAERQWFGGYKPDYDAMILYCSEACRDIGRPRSPALPGEPCKAGKL